MGKSIIEVQQVLPAAIKCIPFGDGKNSSSGIQRVLPAIELISFGDRIRCVYRRDIDFLGGN
jgi:hypothetical protein